MHPAKHLLLPILLCISFSACSCLRQWQDLPNSKEDEKIFYLISHGWHTGIVLASADVKAFDFIPKAFASAAYYEFGWGDRAYYQNRSPDLALSLKALFWPTPSVMHVVALPDHPKRYFTHEEKFELKISSKAMSKLTQFIAHSFKRDREGRISPSQKGLYGQSFFFEAEGRYFFTYTCNTWSAQALSQAGLPLSSFLTLTAGSVMRQTETALKRYPKLP